MKIVIPRSVRLVLSAEKWNVEQTIVNYGQSRQNMQAVPPASSKNFFTITYRKNLGKN